MRVETLFDVLDSDFYTGVPDSQLQALCNFLIDKYGISESPVECYFVIFVKTIEAMQSWLTATSASRVQVILLPQPPEYARLCAWRRL